MKILTEGMVFVSPNGDICGYGFVVEDGSEEELKREMRRRVCLAASLCLQPPRDATCPIYLSDYPNTPAGYDQLVRDVDTSLQYLIRLGAEDRVLVQLLSEIVQQPAPDAWPAMLRYTYSMERLSYLRNSPV